MLSMLSLIKKLRLDYPQFKFEKGPNFLWSHGENTIYYVEDSVDYGFLLHELSHALLNHTEYSRDIELLAMERSAWDNAKDLAYDYQLELDDEFVQSNLDTYRDWLHSRSTCPNCTSTGLQTKNNTYTCLACAQKWTVNEARTCALRRYSKK